MSILSKIMAYPFLPQPGKKTKNDDYFSDKEYADKQLICLQRVLWSDTDPTDDESENISVCSDLTSVIDEEVIEDLVCSICEGKTLFP